VASPIAHDTGWQRRPVSASEPSGFSGTIAERPEAGEAYPADRGRSGGSGSDWQREQVTPKAAGLKTTDSVRRYLAVAFVGCFVLVLGLGYLATATGHWQNSGEWFQAALPATVSLLGSALGFYYGDKRDDR
jgi:hypothetical protein